MVSGHSYISCLEALSCGAVCYVVKVVLTTFSVNGINGMNRIVQIKAIELCFISCGMLFSFDVIQNQNWIQDIRYLSFSKVNRRTMWIVKTDFQNPWGVKYDASVYFL